MMLGFSCWVLSLAGRAIQIGYPMFKTYESLSNGKHQLHEAKQWLTYWVIYFAFYLFESPLCCIAK